MTHPDAGRVRSITWQATLTVATAGALLWVLYTLRTVLLLLSFTVLFCYLVLPLVEILNGSGWGRPGRRLKLPRSLAILIVYIGLALAAFLTIERIVPVLADQISAFVENLPAYARKFDQTIKLLATLPMRYRLPLAWRASLTDLINGTPLRALEWLQALAAHLVELTFYLPWLILIPVIAFFLIKDGPGFHARLIASFPERDARFRLAGLLRDVSQTLAAYIRAQVIACLVVGLVEGAGFWMLGLSYPLVLALAAGLLEFIPVLGPFVVFIVATGVAGFTSWQTAVVVAIFLIVFRLVQDYVIYPRLISEGMELHPVLVILAVVCGAELGGAIGVFLAVPVAALLLVGGRHWRGLTPEPEPDRRLNQENGRDEVTQS